MKTNKYYYSDAVYQLEINLHKVRQELVTMLEYYEQDECKHCLLLKCECIKSAAEYTNDSQSINKNRSKNTSNNEPCEDGDTVNDQSSAPSTERLVLAQDIESWLEASKNVKDYFELDFEEVISNRKSLVTIESVRPADYSLKPLRKWTIFNSSSVSTSSTSNFLTIAPPLNSTTHILRALNFLNSQNMTSSYANATLEAVFQSFRSANK